jgi:hypothetical protein
VVEGHQGEAAVRVWGLLLLIQISLVCGGLLKAGVWKVKRERLLSFNLKWRSYYVFNLCS